MLTADTLRKLATLNLSQEQMSGVLDILADGVEKEEKRKETQRNRARKSRSASRDSNVTVTPPLRDSNVTVTSPSRAASRYSSSPLVPPSDGFPDPSLTPPYNPPITKTRAKKKPQGLFAEFWEVYPHKVGKGAAENAYGKAFLKASHEELLAGVKRYIATKPDDYPYCNPATWLNQERWTDSPAGSETAPAPAKSEISVETLGGNTQRNQDLLKILEGLREQHGESVFRSWLMGLRVVSLSGNALVLSVPLKLTANWIAMNCEESLREEIRKVWPQVQDINIIVGKSE